MGAELATGDGEDIGTAAAAKKKKKRNKKKGAGDTGDGDEVGEEASAVSFQPPPRDSEATAPPAKDAGPEVEADGADNDASGGEDEDAATKKKKKKKKKAGATAEVAATS